MEIDMEMPVGCQVCGEVFDLHDGIGSEKWYKNTVICEECGRLEEQEIELDNEIEDETNNLQDAEWQIKESTKELEKLKVKMEELQNKITDRRGLRYANK